jgi:GNAT superfamily N-acetyltransferase
MNDDVRMRAQRAEVTLRPMREADLAVTHRLVLEVSWPHRPEDLALMFALGGGAVATDREDQVIGVGMWWGFGAAAGTIGTVLVTAGRQGRGIGRALMEALIDQAGPGRALMLNATAEGLGLYERLGFGRIGLVRQHQAKLAGPIAAPPVPAAQIRPAAATDHEALHALDEAAFGAPRTALITRLLTIGQAWVSEENKRVTGFAIHRDFGRGQVIGPVIAPTEDTAIALVAAAGRGARPGVLRLDIPGHAQRLGDWLTASGLPAISTVTTMLRGAWAPAQNGAQRFGLAMQALG